MPVCPWMNATAHVDVVWPWINVNAMYVDGRVCPCSCLCILMVVYVDVCRCHVCCRVCPYSCHARACVSYWSDAVWWPWICYVIMYLMLDGQGRLPKIICGGLFSCNLDGGEIPLTSIFALGMLHRYQIECNRWPHEMGWGTPPPIP